MIIFSKISYHWKNLKNTIITWFLKPTSQWMVTEKLKIIQETVKESDKV